MAASRKLFTVVQCLLALIALLFIVISVVVLVGGAFQDLAALLPSNSFLFLFMGLGIATFLVSILGLFAVARRNTLAFKIQLVLSFFLTVINILFMVYLLLFVNDIPTIPELDNLVNEAFGRGSDATAALALEDPQLFGEIQNSTNCCGVSLQALYNDALNAVDPVRFNSQLTGARCDGARTDLSTFANANPFVGDATLEDFAVAHPDLAKGFFCGDIFFQLVKQNSGIIAGGFGALVFIQTISLICSLVIVCYVPRESGELEFENADSLNKFVLRFSTRPMTLLPQSRATLQAGQRESTGFRSKFVGTLGSMGNSLSSSFSRKSDSGVEKEDRGFIPRRNSHDDYGEAITPSRGRKGRKGVAPPLPPRNSGRESDRENSIPELDDEEF